MFFEAELLRRFRMEIWQIASVLRFQSRQRVKSYGIIDSVSNSKLFIGYRSEHWNTKKHFGKIEEEAVY